MLQVSLRGCLSTTILLLLTTTVGGQEPVRLSERFEEGSRYRVRVRIDLMGSLTLPADKDRPAPQTVKLQGNTAFDYDERVLSLSPEGQVRRALRHCQRMEIQRSFGDRQQQNVLRPAVRRLVLLREKQNKEPFSPDGPLLWTEIDLIRNDVFVPLLGGLLPDRPVKPGDTWQANLAAVHELTGMTKIELGQLDCRLEGINGGPGQRRQAQVAFNATIRGSSDDGRSQQQIQGYYLFDLESNHLAYILLKGVHTLLDARGAEVGRLEGRFVLSRQLDGRFPELEDQAIKGVVLEPTPDNTRLLYENNELGVRFQFGRRWWVTSVRGNQVTMDAAEGHGLLLTIEPMGRLPSGDQFLTESRDWLNSQKARVLRVDPVKPVPGAPGLEHFALEAEMANQRFVMDYYVLRQGTGGALLAARLVPSNLSVVQQEVERLARSLTLGK